MSSTVQWRLSSVREISRVARAARAGTWVALGLGLGLGLGGVRVRSGLGSGSGFGLGLAAMAGTVTSSGGGAARLSGVARDEPMRVNAPGTGMLKMVSRPERQVSTFG